MQYSVIPWLGLTGLGVLFGRWVQRDPLRPFRAAPWIGAALCAAALLLRASGGFGNLRLPRDGGWIEFLNFIKYPPALVFSCSMLGVNLMVLGLMRLIEPRAESVREKLVVFGQTPLFFYIAHF